MKILLLGGNGYIGSRFYQSYSNYYDIESIDLCLFGKELGYSKKVNYNQLLTKFEISNYDAIICLAGHSSVNMCEYSPKRSWVNNVEYFRELCELIENQKLVYASSASVYGTSSGISDETKAINIDPINHYDLQKTTIDMIANKYISQGKKIVGLRFGTVNGVSPNTRADLMINSMVKSSFDTGVLKVKNLHIRRAILGVNDACRAIDSILKNNILSGQYNLASFNSNVRDIAKTISKTTGSDIVLLPDDPISYDFELDTTKFKAAANFEFRDNIQSIAEDLKEQFNNTNFDVRNDDRTFTI